MCCGCTRDTCCLVGSCCFGRTNVESGTKYIAVAGMVFYIACIAVAVYPFNLAQVGRTE